MIEMTKKEEKSSNNAAVVGRAMQYPAPLTPTAVYFLRGLSGLSAINIQSTILEMMWKF